jgi:hypothetical protein
MPRSPRLWRGPVLAGAFFALALSPSIQRRDVSPPPATSKLTGVLAELAQSVPQEQAQAQARATPQGTGPVTPLQIDTMPRSVRHAMSAHRLRINSSNEVQVYILVQAVTDDYLRQLMARGVTIEITDATRRRVQARIPVGRLQAIARLPFVNFVRLPTYAVHRVGSVNTEGDAILRANAVRGQYSLDGTGVRVGVISDGLKGVFDHSCTTCGGAPGGPISTGDLPGAAGTRNARGVLTSSSGGIAGRSFQANGDLEGLPPASPPCGFSGAGAEGTALLEVVHDLAPGAQLSFANADTDMAFNQAVNFLASTNDVVMDDLGFYGEASDGTSPVSSNTAGALNNPSNQIRAYFTSVGNSADEHYFGTYVDSNVDGTTIGGLTTSGHLHLFQQTADTTDVLGRGPQPYNVISLPTSGEVVIFLTWDDPFGASSNNYDLYLVQQSTGRVVASSTDVQSGTQDPMEALDYVNPGGSDFFRIVVQNVRDQAQPKNLNLFSYEPECAVAGPRLLVSGRHERHNYNTATRSVPAQSDAGGSPVSVVSVGAICSASAAASGVFAGSAAPDESCLDNTNSTIEFFSSLGPTLDGRAKPDITGIDGVSVTGAGSFPSPFFGTSAAAPHLAGIAALVLQAAPCLAASATGAVDTVTARTTLRNLILGNAAGLGSPVPNNTFGSGRADAFAAIQRTFPVHKGAAALTVNGNTPLGASITGEQLGFSDPNQCPLTRLSWTGGCGTSPGSTMNCPFGTTGVSVAASNNGVAFSAAADVQVTVTDFAVGVSPGSATVTAGQSSSYVVTLSAQGGAFTAGVTLSCANLPFQAGCTFNPPTVTPGSTFAQSTLTISTTARSSTPARGAHAGAPAPSAPSSWPRSRVPLAAGLAVAVTLLWIGPRARSPRRVAVLGGASVALALLAVQVACGGGSSSNGNKPPASAPSVALSPTSLTFGTQAVQTTSSPQSVTLTNTGNATLSVTSIAASGDFAQTSTCGSSVGAGAGCNINVTFTPTTAGQRSGSLSISDNAPNSPQMVSITGTGAAGGTPAGSYQIGVTGGSGTLVQSSAVTLVVK